MGFYLNKICSFLKPDRMSVSLDNALFYARVEKLYKFWKESPETRSLKKCDAVIVQMGSEEDVVYAKTTTLQTWLVGYELTETGMVFCKDEFFVLTGKKKLEFLDRATKNSPASLPKINLLKREREDNSEKFKKLIEAIKGSGEGKSVGVFAKDNFITKFIKTWNTALKAETFTKVDVSTDFAVIMAAKDENELKLIRLASFITQEVYSKVFKDHIKNIIND